MKYFEIIYFINGKKNKIILKSNHKINALKEFYSMSLGILLSIKETNKPYSLKIKEFIKELNSSFYKKRVNLELYIVALRQLGVMLDAGISLTEALNEVVTSTKDKNIKKIFKQISSDIEMGMSLTQAFEKYSYELGHISVAIINMGEQTGSLAGAVTKLAFILEEIYENKKKLKKAIRYPLIILTTMIIAFIAITRMIVPQFKNMFEEYGAQLPLPTKLLIGLNEFLKDYSVLTLVIIIMIIIIHTLLFKSNKKYKYICDKYIQKIYLIGKITHLSVVGRFIFVFNKLSNSGIPIVDSLTISKNTIENLYFKDKLSQIVQSIEDGKSLAQSFKDSGEFEHMILQMVKSGESTGSLNIMLEKIDKYYNTKYNEIIDNISTYIEPIMIFFIATFLLIMALGIFLPMWSISDIVS